jgi:hypothetical protein
MEILSEFIREIFSEKQEILSNIRNSETPKLLVESNVEVGVEHDRPRTKTGPVARSSRRVAAYAAPSG